MRAGPLLLLLLVATGMNAVAASFDCAKTTTKVEKMICSDADLSKLDEELANSYRQAKKDLHNAPWLEEQQRLWLKHRNGCNDRACVESNYRDRLSGIAWYVEIEKDPEETVAFERPHNIIHEDKIRPVILKGLQDTYGYKLEVNNDDTVCRHMQKVYNAFFRQPWATHVSNSKAYASDGIYAFPRYPGLEGFDISTGIYSHSRRPSSPEFDAVPWREALRFDTTPDAPPLVLCEQYRKERTMGPKGTRCFFALLIADFDIDNDGKIETVVKDNFMTEVPQITLHTRDHYRIFPQGSVDPWQYYSVLRDQYEKHDFWPRVFSNDPFMARPFILNGVSYLSSYRRWYKDENSVNNVYPDNEYMEIFKTNGMMQVDRGARYINNEYQMDLVCRFRMQPQQKQ